MAVALLGIGEDGDAWESQCCVFPRVKACSMHSTRSAYNVTAALVMPPSRLETTTCQCIHWGILLGNRRDRLPDPETPGRLSKHCAKGKKARQEKAVQWQSHLPRDSGNDTTTETT